MIIDLSPVIRAVTAMGQKVREFWYGPEQPDPPTLAVAQVQLRKAVTWTRIATLVPAEERQAIVAEARSIVRDGLRLRFGDDL